MNKKEKKLLFNYFDGNLSEAEQQKFNLLLEKSEIFRNEKGKYEQMRAFISENAEKSLKPFFETKIFNTLNQQPETTNLYDSFDEYLNFIFRKMLAPALIIILFLLSFNLISTGEISVNAALGIPNVSIEEVMNPTFDLVMEQQ